ncbi:hypothetical protein G9A89_013836 [Geosiphon pyriformis]|nr:hypothetical protein G9A89_013836 [Geosiphon pyriformis]
MASPPNVKQQQQQPQLLSQQNQQQPQQQPMAYAPIAKIKKFTSEENNAQIWLNNMEKAIEFKTAFLGYFSNNNSINCLANTFTIIKQGETEAVTTYLGCFHRNLHQIQAIQADYFTVPQILNQFIRGLHSSLFQCVHPMHSQTLQNAIINARNFELAKLKASHAQAVNLETLDRKPPKTGDQQWLFTNQFPVHPTSHQNYNSGVQEPATIIENESLAAIFLFEIEELTETPLFSGATLEEKPIMVMYTDAKINSQFIKLILDSGLAGSIITRQFIDQLGHQVDQAANARIITADGATKTPIGKIDNLPIEINGITVLIKILVIEATQYQALVGNNWLFKIKMTLDWNTQELQLSQNRQHTHVPATCGHFKLIITPSALLIKFEEKKKNLPGKHTKSLGPTKTTTSYHRYFFGTTREKRRKTKNLLGILTKTGKLIMTKMNQQTGNELWRMAYAKAESMTISKLLEIKNNPLSLPEPKYVQTFNVFGNIEDNSEEFYEHYQCLALTREEQEQCLEQLNT